MVYINRALPDILLSESYRMAALTDISRNRILQTIGNRYDGGERGGCCTFSNFGIPMYVTIPPSTAKINVMTNEYRNDFHLSTTISPFQI